MRSPRYSMMRSPLLMGRRAKAPRPWMDEGRSSKAWAAGGVDLREVGFLGEGAGIGRKWRRAGLGAVGCLGRSSEERKALDDASVAHSRRGKRVPVGGGGS